MKLGVIGLGIMGAPMAANLLKAGYELTVYNRTAAKAEKLRTLGANVAASPKHVAAAADSIITMVSGTPDVQEVLFGKNGVAEGLTPGKIAIDMSTISPEAAQVFAEKIAARGCDFLDAPVSGGEPGAIAGTLTIMVGGSKAAFEKCLPVLSALGKNIVHAGASGSGQCTKMVNQVICSLNIVAMTEGLLLAQHTGLDLERTLQAVAGGAAGSWMLNHLAPRILRGDFAPGFMIKLQQKDLRLAMELLEEVKEKFPGVALAHELFSQAAAQGLGEQGTQGLINLMSDEFGGR
jgi:3-hydroxyisobutyrate dehydrogenase